MLQFIIDLLFSTPEFMGEANQAFLGLVAGGIASAVGGLIQGGANRRARRRSNRANELVQLEGDPAQMEIPPELQQMIDQLSKSDYFLPMLQRLTANNTQGAHNITRQMNRAGVDSPGMVSEMIEQGERQRTQSITQGMDQLEGMRLGALSDSVGQMLQANTVNANLKQRHQTTNASLKQNFVQNRLGIEGEYGQNAMGIWDSTLNGIFGPVVQSASQGDFDGILNLGKKGGGKSTDYGTMPGFASGFGF